MATIHRQACEVCRTAPENQKGLKKISFSRYDENANSCVFLHRNDFKKIFGDRRGRMDKYRNSPPIVKISRKETGQSIHRVYRTDPDVSCKLGKCAGLTYTSLLNLSLSNEDYNHIGNLELTIGNSFVYYWNHPHHATRISMRLGVISIVMGAISLLTAII